jgi:hypothetical protein
VALAIVAVALLRVHLIQAPLERDEGEYAYAGQLMLQGIPPYQLACNMKLPGTYAAYALILAAFGQSIAAIHAGLLVANAGAIVLIFLLGRRLFSDAAGLAACAAYALLSVSAGVLGTQAHATHFVVLAALAGLLLLRRYSESPRPWTLWSSGLLFGLAYLMKQHGIFFGLFGAAYLVAEGRWKKLPLFLAGAAAPFGLTCLILWRAGVFSRFWFWTFTYARHYGSENSLADGVAALAETFGPILRQGAGVWILAAGGLAMLVGWVPSRRRADAKDRLGAAEPVAAAGGRAEPDAVVAAKREAAAEPVVAAEPASAANAVVAADPEAGAHEQVAAEPVVAAKREAAAEPASVADAVVAADPEAGAHEQVAAEPVVAAKREAAAEPVVAADGRVGPDAAVAAGPRAGTAAGWPRSAVFVIGLLVFSFAAICPGLYFRAHYVVLMLPAIALLAGSAVRGRVSGWLFAAALVVSVATQREFLFRMSPVEIARELYGFDPFPEAIPMAAYIRSHTANGARIAVIGSEPEIYFYAHRHSATSYIYIEPMVEPQPFALTMQNDMVRELERAAPEYVVRFPAEETLALGENSPTRLFDWWAEYGPQHYRVVGIADILSDYRTEYRWDAAAEEYQPKSLYYLAVYRRK